MGGHTVTVIFSDTLLAKNSNYGECNPDQQTITLQTPNKVVNKQYITQTFYHELAHYAMHQMGEMDLFTNERFIDALGHMLHQFSVTRKN